MHSEIPLHGPCFIAAAINGPSIGADRSGELGRQNLPRTKRNRDFRSKESKEKADSFDGNLDLITAYCNHFYIAFQRLNRKKERPKHNIYLTPRGQEVLTWAATGNTDSEIGTILTMSDDTVDTYMRRIFKKLKANARVMAVSKAISYGLIRP